jgi:TldD protein
MSLLLDNLDLSLILAESLTHGGEFADIFAEESSSTSVVLDDNRIERVLAATDRGVGLRVLADLRTSYAYGNDISQKALLELATTVRTAIQGNAADSLFAVGPKRVGFGFPISLPPDQVPLPRKVALVERANRVARAVDPRIRQVSVILRDSQSITQIANSAGDLVESRRTGVVLIVQAIAEEDGVIQTGYEPLGGFRGLELLTMERVEEIAETAARRALLMLGARKAPGGVMPVVLSSEAGGTMVHEAIGHGLEADLVQAGTSVYAGKIGMQVASPLVTVIDDATIPFARGSFSFDDEGMPAQRTILVENGILKGYLYDRLTAMKEGRSSTGNGRRESYQAKPIVRMTNTLIAPGTTHPASIVKGVGWGLFVRKMGGGQVNTVTGDFVFEVSEGYLINNGELGEAVRGATLTGNGPAVLMQIDAVGSDLGFGIGTCGKEGQGVPVADAQPTLLIREMTVGGAA